MSNDKWMPPSAEPITSSNAKWTPPSAEPAQGNSAMDWIMRPAAQNITGNTLQNMGMAAAAMPIPQSNQRPFDAGVTMASQPINRIADFDNRLGGGMMGSASDMATTPINYALGGAFKYGGKLLPKIYTDTLINQTAQSALTKINGAVQPLRDTYKALLEPFSNQQVDSETFQKALSVVPKSARQDFIDDYGSQVVDAKGNPQTTIGNLQKMELELKDKISQPKYGQTINAQSYNFADAAQKLKNIRMNELPDNVQAAVQTLDKKFGPVVNMSSYLLPKIANKAGGINTKFLYNVFKNPADAGTREYLSNLKDLGVDLSPEMNVLKGWVARSQLKKFSAGAAGLGAAAWAGNKFLVQPLVKGFQEATDMGAEDNQPH